MGSREKKLTKESRGSVASWGKHSIGGGMGRGEKAAIGRRWGDNEYSLEVSDQGVRDMSEISKGFFFAKWSSCQLF
jgi:hypothetical protein